MPKKDFSKGMIYKWCCLDKTVTDVYVGSTCNFKSRMKNHKDDYIRKNFKYRLNAYEFMDKNGGMKNWEMVLVEKYPCKDNLELRARERYWKEHLNSTLNIYNPIRTKKDVSISKKIWRETHKEYMKDYQHKYRETNKEKLSEQKKQYLKKYKKDGKHIKKCQYCGENKTHIIRHEKTCKSRPDYIPHVKIDKSEKINCEYCQKKITRGNMNRHIKKSCKKVCL